MVHCVYSGGGAIPGRGEWLDLAERLSPWLAPRLLLWLTDLTLSWDMLRYLSCKTYMWIQVQTAKRRDAAHTLLTRYFNFKILSFLCTSVVILSHNIFVAGAVRRTQPWSFINTFLDPTPISFYRRRFPTQFWSHGLSLPGKTDLKWPGCFDVLVPSLAYSLSCWHHCGINH